MTMQIQTLRYAHTAIEKAAFDNATMKRLRSHGNPIVRHAADIMRYLAGMPDQATAERRQAAENVLYYLPLNEIERLVREFA